MTLKETKETLLLGEINLDFFKWSRTDLLENDSGRALKPPKNELFSRIIPQGVSQLVTEGTKISPSGTLSGLDHIDTNKPEKCSHAVVK